MESREERISTRKIRWSDNAVDLLIGGELAEDLLWSTVSGMQREEVKHTQWMTGKVY